MSEEPITLNPASELARLLARAEGKPVIIEHNGVRYRIEPEDPFAFYDPKKMQAAIRAGASAFKRVDTEQPRKDTREMCGHDPEAVATDREALRRIIREAKPKAKSLEWGPETRYGREDDFNNGYNEALDEYETALLKRFETER